MTYVGVELSDEAGEIVVLEISGEKKASELRGVPNDEAGVGGAPRNDVVGGGIVHHVVRLQEERRRTPGAGGGGGRCTIHYFAIQRISEWIFLESVVTCERETERC